jgi:hypothetical protein
MHIGFCIEISYECYDEYAAKTQDCLIIPELFEKNGSNNDSGIVFGMPEK